MPRFSRLRSSVLEDLAAQQRFAPARALRRQVERAESLIGEIEPGGAYPEDWVIFRITGFRPDLAEPASLVGEALLSDLPALVERLSDGAAYTAAELADESLAPGELCKRWRIGRRTLERYRRFGLAARRARTARGKPAIRFMRAQVEAFERREPARLSRGGSSGVRRRVRRVSAEERVELHGAAAALAGGQGASLARASFVLAGARNRAVTTVRRAVLKQERGVPTEERFFPQRAAITDTERRAIFEAHRLGEEPGTLVLRFARSRASIHRIVNEQRAAALRTIERVSPGPANEKSPAMVGAGAGFDPRFFSVGARQGLGAPVPLAPAAFAADARSAPAAVAREEQGRAAAYHALRAEAGRRIAALPRFNPASGALDEIESLLRWATLIKVELARSQSGLVLRTIEERAACVFEELSPDRMLELHARAFDAVGRAIDGFDQFPRDGKRPGRLAAPAMVELARALAPLDAPGTDDPGSRARPPAARRKVDSLIVLRDWTRTLTPWQAWLDPPRGTRERCEEFPEPAREIALRHFGWMGEPPMAFDTIHQRLGVSRRRIAITIRAAVAAAGAETVEREEAT